MHFCPTCGSAVKIKGIAKTFGAAVEIMTYEPVDETDAQRAMVRVRKMISGIKETLASGVLTANAKLDLIQSDVQRVMIDLPPPEPAPEPRKKYDHKGKKIEIPSLKKPAEGVFQAGRVVEVSDDGKELDEEDEVTGLDALADDLVKKALRDDYDPDLHPANAAAIAENFIDPDDIDRQRVEHISGGNDR